MYCGGFWLGGQWERIRKWNYEDKLLNYFQETHSQSINRNIILEENNE